MTYAVIPADHTKPVEFKEGLPTYDEIRGIVGGWLEGVTVQEADEAPALRFYCNEEGRLIPLPPNGRATALRVIATRGQFHPDGLLIAGDVAVVGGYDRHGDDTGLTEAQIAYLQKLPTGTAAQPGRSAT